MDVSKQEELARKADVLRVELKAWEKEFASGHKGQKASREDIKQYPDIALKYKEYNKTRDILAGKVVADIKSEKHQTPRKRKYESQGHGVSKRQQISQTPSKNVIHPWEVDPYDSPSIIRNLFTPKKALGPTPQKDGQVLGLFDLLNDEETEASPLKTKDTQSGLPVPIQATPRKAMNDARKTVRHSRTPASVSKRRMLDAFATPLKTKTANISGAKTPLSVSKLQFATPSFLRRDSQRTHLPAVDENEEDKPTSPQMIRVPRKPLVRGLSSMLAGLRKMADDAADDDLDALREVEMEEANLVKPVAKPLPKIEEPDEKMLMADSQPGFPLGGFDDAAMYDSAPEEPKGPDGQPLKVYKKKGQKRTTRKVNMKPSRSKPTAALPMPEASAEESEGELIAEEVVAETRRDEVTAFADAARNLDSDSQSEYTASDGGTRYRRPDQKRTKNKRVNHDGKIKTAARKVTAMANQNFKRLKLRNSGAKGGVAHNSRFRRKR